MIIKFPMSVPVSVQFEQARDHKVTAGNLALKANRLLEGNLDREDVIVQMHVLSHSKGQVKRWADLEAQLLPAVKDCYPTWIKKGLYNAQ